MTVENLPRRQFLRGKFLASLHTKKEQIQGFEGIRPPWSVANNEFIAQCTRCGDCVDICETQILVKGEGGFPEVRFDKGECTFCGKCVEICQQPIFRSLTGLPWEHKIEIGASCLAQRHIECRACQDNCPQNAIRFRLQMGGVAQPIVDLESCNGCGACVKTCPVDVIKISNTK
ncbi:ferredoxin-type protein NapF [Rodentibacter myodis]|uniref:Ferredoxin-type protein NapF n=1 Tax=Rodentibacter myodis TaxID=1907939 RepID=A0A1V3JM27_9PAST|nr:ferredoxin-type protein NapF [Rodentibacter myodis]OOF57708.1 ferredoxin-type protein NapF [Rodentibacter myodis]